jgi:hypothetical protein
MPLLSETSDYGSGTDPELQSIQHISPQTDSSPLKFDFDEPSFSYLIDDPNNNLSPIRRTSLSSSSSSSSSSTSTSPSSSISNLSSLSSSSEVPANFKNQNRLSNKKFLSLNNNNNTSNDLIICHCEKENLSNRKRNRFNSYPNRRYTTINYCENCQIKRSKLNSRSKYYSNRQQKQRSNNRYYDQTLTPIKFSIDLTGFNINYTIEYHDNIKCTCSTTLLPYYNSSINHCKCFSLNDWSLFLMMNSLNDYYIDTNNTLWFQQQSNSSLFNYYDLYLTKSNDNNNNNNNNLSLIYFDDNSIVDINEHLPSYYFRCMTPSIDIECEEKIFIRILTNSWRSAFFSFFKI